MKGAQNDFFLDSDEGFALAEHIVDLDCMLAFRIGPDANEKTHHL